MKANCPLRFINSVINEFTNGKTFMEMKVL